MKQKKRSSIKTKKTSKTLSPWKIIAGTFFILIVGIALITYKTSSFQKETAAKKTSTESTYTESTESETVTEETEISGDSNQMSISSKENWKTVTYKGVSFQIPPEAIFKDGSYQASSSQIRPVPVYVLDYKGGSRREEFLDFSAYKNCNWIFEEGYFGNVSGIKAAADGGECNGSAGGIIAVVGNKLVVFGELYYNENGTIPNTDQWNTIISTMKVSEL